jgi:hypothetical protein
MRRLSTILLLGVAGWGLPAISFGDAPTTNPSDVSKEIQIQRGRSGFEAGDTIVITSVRGPGDAMAPGNSYEIQGTYILSSHDDARLFVGVTSKAAGSADTDADSRQSAVVEKGMGEFDLVLPFKASGYPFISFNSSSGDVSFGELYFGTPGTVLQAAADTSNNSSASADGASGPPARSVALGVSTADTNFAFVPSTSTPPVPPAQPGTPPNSFPDVVQFVIGGTHFLPGDEILIQEVRGTASTLQPGNWYQISGIYSLASHPQATLATFVTATGSANGESNVASVQTKAIGGGTGKFVLVLPMLYPGDPHVSFYPAGGGESFGSAYFGTGDNILQSVPDDVPDALNFSLDNSNVVPGPVSNPTQNPQQLNPQPLNPQMPQPTFPQPQPVGGGTKSK